VSKEGLQAVRDGRGCRRCPREGIGERRDTVLARRPEMPESHDAMGEWARATIGKAHQRPRYPPMLHPACARGGKAVRLLFGER